MKIVITGASGGIGSALVNLARERGDYVIGISRSGKNADVNYNCDVLDVQCLAEVAEEVGDVDGLALLHGHGSGELWNKKIDALSGDDFLEVFKIDVVGSFNVVKAFAPNLKTNSSVVFATSTPAIVGDVYGVPYAVAKGALISLTRSLAKILSPIRVNSVAFGPVETKWVEWIDEVELSRFRERTLLKRLATPREAAEAIYWLLSPSSSYVTGQLLIVDGGESL